MCSLGVMQGGRQPRIGDHDHAVRHSGHSWRCIIQWSDRLIICVCAGVIVVGSW